MFNAPHQHMEEFIRLLKLTLVADNIQRKDSEERLKTIDQETKSNLLLQVLMNEKDLQVIEIASLMLRQTIDRASSPSTYSEVTMNNMKNTIPQLCLQQQVQNVRRKYVDIITSLATLCYTDGKNLWPEINVFFYDCLVRSNHDIGMEIGFRIIESAPFLLNDFNDDLLANVMTKITDTMSSNAITHKSLVIDALKAFSSLIVDLSIKRIKRFLDIPFQIIFHLIRNSNDYKVVGDFLEELTVLVECRPKIVREYVITLVETMMSLLVSQYPPDEIRMEAMECIVAMAEHSKKTFVAKAKEFLPAIVDIYIRHITLIQEDPSWAYSSKDEGEEEENDIPTTAETCLDRLTCCIGGKLIFPIVMERISPLLSSKIWQHRCAALITISCIAEGCVKTLKPHLPKVIEAVVPFIKDENPRVVYYCINTLGQLAVDYVGYFHSTFHQQVFPVIFYASEAYPQYPRLQAHAVCCFVNLLDGCPIKIAIMYSDQFFQRLHSLFISSVNGLDRAGMPIVLENVLSSLAKLAETIHEDFVKYYRMIAPELITLIRSFSTTPHVKFYILSLETLGSILLAVGQKECIHELDSVLDVLKSFEIRSINSTDSNRNYQLEYMEIMGTIAEVFGRSFSPILPTLFPVLLELVAAPVENQLITSTLSTFENTSDRNSISRAFSAHTDALSDKHKASLILQKMCMNLKDCLSTYLDDICNTMIKNFTECYDDDIQSSSCDTFPLILKCAETQSSNAMLQMWAKIFTSFYSRMLRKDELFSSNKVFEGICACIKVVSYNGLASDFLVKIVEMINIELSRLIKEATDRVQSNLLNDDFEVDDLNEEEDLSDFEEDLEEEILSSIQELTRILFKMLTVNFSPYFNQTFENVIKLTENPNQSLKCWGLCILSDLIEFTPNESVQLSSRFLDKIKESIEDQDSSVRQSAIFLVGVMVEHANQHYQNFISFSLPTMVSLITGKDSRDDEHASATANAIAVVGKIMKFCPNIISPFDSAVTTWLSWLPVVEDEVDFILAYLIDLIETKFQVVAGPNNQNLFKSLDSIATMIPHADEEVSKRAVTLLSQLNAHMPDSFDYWYKNLNTTLKENIEYAKTSNA